jgi:exosome complex RNA-binding protein Rrp42 (RNase PH superfamily)
MRDSVNAKQSVEFVRASLLEGRRLDGRGLRDYRALQINVASSSSNSSGEVELAATGRAEVLMGKTRYGQRLYYVC